jgi:arylsulfatase A-like enzyme
MLRSLIASPAKGRWCANAVRQVSMRLGDGLMGLMPMSLMPIIFGSLLIVPAIGQESAESRRPNVIVIIADDLGYGETGMMGNRQIPTPAIDALASSGVRCTSGYVTSSYCSGSRAGLMTGRYQSRFGYEMNPTGKRNLHPEAGLPESETTFVSQLQQAGYATSLVGKWHLGTVDPKRPLRRGFDEFYGFLHEGHFYVPGPPYEGVLTMIRDRSLPKGERVREGDLIRGNYANMSEPDYDGDNPILRGEEEIVEPDYLTDAITDEAVDFIERHAEQEFCLVVSYSAVHSPMQARMDDLETVRWISDDQRRIFAGMLIALDRGVERISGALREHGLRRNTLVVFLSDNGGPTAELTSSNAPLRDGKGSVYEGGLRVPMVWSMPGRISAGQSEPRVVLSLDIAATALEIAGLPRDESMDGRSVLEWFDAPSRAPLHEDVYWQMSNGKTAYRLGNWKIVRPKEDAPIELYHLAGDVGESRNLASEHPAKLRELVNRWRAIQATMPPPIELPR